LFFVADAENLLLLVNILSVTDLTLDMKTVKNDGFGATSICLTFLPE